jgi:heme A synthase
VTELHQIAAIGALIASFGLLAAAAWSFVAARRSGGEVDHRYAVDRLVILATATIALGGLLGASLVVGGGRPADPLHLLYGAVAMVTPAAGWWMGHRDRAAVAAPGTAGGGVPTRRDGWLVVAAIVLLGVELRLFMTG